jgi:hypothetical protein
VPPSSAHSSSQHSLCYPAGGGRYRQGTHWGKRTEFALAPFGCRWGLDREGMLLGQRRCVTAAFHWWLMEVSALFSWAGLEGFSQALPGVGGCPQENRASLLSLSLGPFP